MAATTTVPLSSIPNTLREDFPQFTFIEGVVSHWSPVKQTVFHQPINSHEDTYSLFHELGHAVCGHTDFEQDISLVRMEREAWEAGQKIAKKYGFTISTEYVENALDSYRDWMYARSRCPACNNPGVQKKATGFYTCLLCGTPWRANDARQCGLKRYTL